MSHAGVLMHIWCGHLNMITMRAHEILREQSHEDQARDALITLLTTQHALGIPDIPMEKLLHSLEDRNYFMDADWVQAQVSNIPVVDAEASNNDQIKLKLPRAPQDDTPVSAPTPDGPAAPDRVAAMAKKALAKRNS
jgi:hypothetical protein